MSERGMSKTVMKLLRALHPVNVELATGRQGVPDIECMGGWIELKRIASWPVRRGRVRLDHFTDYQKLFLRERQLRGGKAWLLLHVEKTNEWLLFQGAVAAEHLGTADVTDLIELSYSHWDSTPSAQVLQKVLMDG